MLRFALIGTTAVVALGASLGATTLKVRRSAESSHGETPAFVSSPCDTSYAWGGALRDYVVPIVTASGTGADRTRAVTHLPSALPSDVAIVTNDSVCAAAYNAHVARNYAGDTTRLGKIGLVQVGATRYVLEDIHRRAGEWQLLDVYDSSFKYLSSFTR